MAIQLSNIVIAAALPDPKGNQNNEWLELRNISVSPISLEGWYLSDQLSRLYILDGIIEATEHKQFHIRSEHPHSMQLGNSSGLIALYSSDGIFVFIVTYKQTTPRNIVIF